jgi:hypothetical protein
MRAAAATPERAGRRDGDERRDQRDHAVAPRGCRRGPHVELPVPARPGHDEPPRPHPDRALDRVDPDDGAERRLARRRDLHDAGEVARMAVDLVDGRRRPADAGDEEASPR